MASLLLLSGGMDSSCLLHEYQTSIAICLFVRMGKKQNVVEEKRVKDLCLIYGKQLEIVSCKNLFQKITTPDYFVPFRNGILLSIGVGVAEAHNIDTVLIGTHLTASGYADCTPDFANTFDYLVSKYNECMHVKAPYRYMTKKQIVERGEKLGFDFALTYSCYAGSDDPCGECPACVSRKEAMDG